MDDAQLRETARRIKLLLMDCDGVLTDGRLYMTADGEAMKVFNVRDGQGISLWHKAGFRSGVITGRDAEQILRKRAEELGMHFLSVRSQDKVRDLEAILVEAGATLEETAFIGDDLADLPVMELAGLGVAVADAVPAVLEGADHVTRSNGREGAVREVIDLLISLKSEH